MAKTILKLYENGDFETFVPINQNRNLYVISDSAPGYIFNSNGTIRSQVQGARYVSFIPVTPGEIYTFQCWWDKPELFPIDDVVEGYGAWSIGFYYDANFSPYSKAFEIDSAGIKPAVDYHVITFTVPEGVSYIGLSSNELEGGENGRIQFERGDVPTSYSLSAQDVIQDNPNLINHDTLALGYLDETGYLILNGENTIHRTTDFISVSEGESYTFQLYPMTSWLDWLYASLTTYDANYNHINLFNIIDQQDVIPFETTWICPQNVAYIRITVSDFESYSSSFKLNTPLQLSFSENSIILPKIIEYPPPNYRNHFIEKTSESGFVWNAEGLLPPNEYDRVSDFIPVSGWEDAIVCLRFKNMNGAYRAWVAITIFDESKVYIDTIYEQYLSENNQTGDLIAEIPILVSSAFIRVTTNYYDHPETDVKLSVEKGTTATQKHYLAFEDMPEWVRDTGQPISIFPEGIVIKGDLLQSSE